MLSIFNTIKKKKGYAVMATVIDIKYGHFFMLVFSGEVVQPTYDNTQCIPISSLMDHEDEYNIYVGDRAHGISGVPCNGEYPE